MKRKLLHQDAAARLVAFRPDTKFLIVSLSDLLTLVIAAAACYWLARTGLERHPAAHGTFSMLAPLLSILFLYTLGVFRAVARFVTSDHILRIIGGVFGGTLVAGTAAWLLGGNAITAEFAALYATGGSILLIVTRTVAAAFLRPALHATREISRAMIYGAGAAGTQLAAALQISGRFYPVAFVDHRRDIQGRNLLGLPVYAPEQLNTLKAAGRFDQILLAIPSVNGARRRELLESLAPLAAKVMVVPSLEDLAGGKHRLDELHEVRIEELLSRESVAAHPHLLQLHITGKTVMVTGAGGTIGSELCRQVIDQGASRLVMLDHSEFGLYAVHRELGRPAFVKGCELIPVLGSVNDEALVISTMHRHVVESVYHAAAYKHVPLVEQNAVPAIMNNVFGTLIVAKAAVRCGVSNFVLISTDKAVRPSSIMGATKRICELIVQALAVRHPNTCMSMVRFGNVLASSGSVIPLFESQIRRGGPVTVTHPEVTRYFMTIGEAAQLVIQAGAMGSRGDVFVLDMGEPIRILTLAERMIRLSGLQVRSAEKPDGDIDIEVIGLRPGEKLHEELFIGERPGPTAHPRIFKASESFLAWPELEARLHALRATIASGNADDMVWAVHQLAREPRGHDGMGDAEIATAARQANLRVVRDSQQ